MKKLFVILILFYFSQTIIAQKSLVANLKQNIIYNGVSNPIQVMLPICNYDSLSVTASRGTLNKTANGYYSWIVCEQTESESARVRPIIFIKAFQNGQLIYEDETEFRLKYAPNPNPIPIVGGSVFTHRLGKTHISDCRGMAAILDDFDYVGSCKIEYYKVIYIRSGELFKEWKNEGGVFEKYTKENLKQAKKGDTIIFSDIIARCNCDDFTRDLGELEFEIKD